jgi:hypothetical protein
MERKAELLKDFWEVEDLNSAASVLVGSEYLHAKRAAKPAVSNLRRWKIAHQESHVRGSGDTLQELKTSFAAAAQTR